MEIPKLNKLHGKLTIPGDKSDFPQGCYVWSPGTRHHKDHPFSGGR